MQRNMKLTKDKHVRMSEKEYAQLQTNAAAACMTDSAFIRQLITGNVPVAQPDERFWQAMELIREFADKIDEIAMKTDNSVDMIAVMTEARKWRLFQNTIEKALLRPRRGDG